MTSQLPWFRMYHEARIDAKLRSLSDPEFRVWFDLLCFAAAQKKERGAITGYDEELLALEVARNDVDLLCTAIKRLVVLHILEPIDDGIRFIHFNERQYDKPSDAPEATRRRQRQSRASRARRPSSSYGRVSIYGEGHDVEDM